MPYKNQFYSLLKSQLNPKKLLLDMEPRDVNKKPEVALNVKKLKMKERLRKLVKNFSTS
jgi:hypothetical protein